MINKMDKKQRLGRGDHRSLGRDLDLFVFSDLVGSGLPLFTPRGTIVRDELDRFVRSMHDAAGLQAVTIPHITKSELYKKSGHWHKFSDDLFKIVSRDKHEFAMKPMNCPHHAQIYASRPRSYRDLPIRYRETTTNYRDEHTGELNGLLRARSFTQDDAHIFCREDQILAEVLTTWDIIEIFYKTVGLKLSLRQSKRDPKKPKDYAGDDKMWQRAEAELQTAIDAHPHAKIAEGVGDAAFYGPKLDFIAHDAHERQWQVATIQIDFAQPDGLDLTYINEKGASQRPVMIHYAVMGSIERFLAVYLEHTGGKLPIWLSPEQIRVIALNNQAGVLKQANQIIDRAKDLGLRAELDDSNETLSKKIRTAELMHVPYSLIIGEKEVASGKVTPRVRKDIEVQVAHAALGVEPFLKTVANEAKTRVSKTSL